jgi:hypothetical protein
MATTTPNYGWPVPTSSDLVKNGATAIEALGDAADATMATMVAKSIVDAKGDIIAATAADTVSRLAVGANDTVLTADSTAATGLKWATAGGGGLTYAAWTPTTTGITTGNGTTVARYAQSGKFVTGSFNFTLGSTSALTGAAVSFTLPVTAKAAFVLNGNATFLRTGVGYEPGMTLQASTTICYIGTFSTSTTYPAYVDLTATIPHTWANGDFLSVNFEYEAA